MKHLRITVEGHVYDVVVEAVGEGTPAAQATPTPTPAPATPAPATASGGKPIVAPLAAVVVEIHVAVGQKVNIGDKVLTIEAMKMNTVVSSAEAGTVTSISVSKGDAVEEGAELLTLG